ncbi:hypothetical protein AgCh_018241 [Apium graveolens]
MQSFLEHNSRNVLEDLLDSSSIAPCPTRSEVYRVTGAVAKIDADDLAAFPADISLLRSLKLLYRKKDIKAELRRVVSRGRPKHGCDCLQMSLIYSANDILVYVRASYWRNPFYTAARFLITIVIALLFGTMFWDLGTKRIIRHDLFNSMRSMDSTIIFIEVQNASSGQPVVAVERTVLYRERAAGIYTSLAYALAQLLMLHLVEGFKERRGMILRQEIKEEVGWLRDMLHMTG